MAILIMQKQESVKEKLVRLGKDFKGPIKVFEISEDSDVAYILIFECLGADTILITSSALRQKFVKFLLDELLIKYQEIN